jgi:hypothetical protein
MTQWNVYIQSTSYRYTYHLFSFFVSPLLVEWVKQKNNRGWRLAVVQSGAGGGIKLCARKGIKAKVYPPSEGRRREPVVLVSVLF